MKLSSIVSQVADGHLTTIRNDGSMPAGHNGLYRDNETPVRNTSHWLLTFSSLYCITNDDRFKDAAVRTSTYLTGSDARPSRGSFFHRETEKKDRCNGLIGQAWTIEALTVAASAFGRTELADSAEEVFLLHPQDQRTGLWKRVEINGQTLPFDATFNHQLWFAAAGGLLANLPSTLDRIDAQVRTFLDELETNLRLYPSGLIYHPLKPTGSPKRLLHLMRADERGRIGVTFLTSSVPLPSRRRDLKWKAIGYHAFNLYAFALLKQQYPDHNFWETPKWKRALEYVTTSEYRDAVWRNEYGSPYNPVGFEVPFAMEVFGIGTTEERRQLITKQLDRHYNIDTNRMDRNTPDEETLTARIYQATRLEDLSLPDFEPT